MKKLLAWVLPAGFLFILPVAVLNAQFGEVGNFLNAFKGFLNVVTGVIIALALVFFLWGLMMFVASAGDEDKRSKGKQIMIWGIIAFFVMVAIWGIINLLITIFPERQPPAPPAIPGL